ncbi:transglycosylase SLT domain-containing protein [Gracilibacillus salitolerans]|uniref:Transglycosylase SLT domain-containing protein n=1 Tax=Gracilibacillus salitolerans TaxID=2663022 RepID=A0A5Q2TMX0_9BACI|nr:lysozyme family protein [Gracilibacillus salitolerans]QGH36136.1 transglycosylase SLT domain-containing protein [Gracilibacillus salitolerans]
MNQRQWKKWKGAVKQLFLVGFILVSVLFIISWVGSQLANQSLEQGINKEHLPALSEEIWEYKQLVEKYAKQHGMEEHVNTILAMMMQESGGRGKDPMQSSESLCGERGCIDDPEISIEQGVAFFAHAMERADGDLKLAIQSYNFGPGFIEYVRELKGEYSEDTAIAYSQKMYEEAGKDESIYSCLRAEAEELEACYGDIYYVKSVMSYKEAIDMELERGEKRGGWL